MATNFQDCWREYVRRRRLPPDPLAAMPPQTVAQARRDALEFFSQGAVHLRAQDEAFAQLFAAEGGSVPTTRENRNQGEPFEAREHESAAPF